MHSQRPEVFANKIRMLRSRHTGAFIVVEGRDDRLFLSRFIKPQLGKPVTAEGKENVRAVVSILEKEEFPGVVGLVDADFDHLEEIENSEPNMIVTEHHDLECFQLRSNSLEVLLSQLASDHKIQRLEDAVRDKLIETAKTIGCLRLYSKRAGLNLRFSKLKYSRFIDQRTLELDQDALIGHVKGKSEQQGISNKELISGIIQVGKNNYDPWQLCNGDDLLGILSIGLRRLLGNRKAIDVNVDKLRESLRLGFVKDEFIQSQIGRELAKWGVRNSEFRMIE